LHNEEKEKERRRRRERDETITERTLKKCPKPP